ncbi:vWA domain-containing protein [Paenibacillus assamensis]|uniref:vWA domain-containing protein n=1 Tax=Paenibacillus assamensis TaxID=311244 RepID=UPI0003F806B3|nr:vWA domain-containing protein [Paenibacillus assamensis]
MLKQILLITDGCSNVGIQPAVAAAQAREAGIAVNVVGIVDDGTIGEYGAAEIEEIARMGGGVSRVVNQRNLSYTIQQMTRKTVVQTIHQVVNHELKHILGRQEGGTSVEALPPSQRAEVVRVMDEMSEQSALRVALLIDASASMKPKLPSVEEAIRDLMLSLQARQGKSEIAVFHFPGNHSDEPAKLDVDWVSDLSKMKRLLHRIPMRGTTPTGPALLHVLDYCQYDSSYNHSEQYGDIPARQHEYGSDGVWSDYVL